MRCSRCERVLDESFVAIDASKASTGRFDKPESIQICLNCLKPGESPNTFGIFLADDGHPRKRGRVDGKEAELDTSILENKASYVNVPQSMSDLDWQILLKPHISIHELIQGNKVCAPQITKKTIWWRLYHTWNMDEFSAEVTQPLAYCNLCGKVIKLSKVDRSPTPLKRHLEIQHKRIFSVLNAQKLKDGPVLSPRGNATNYQYVKSKGRKEVNRASQLKAITQWIIETDQSPDVVESESFRKMTSALVNNPRHFNIFDKNAVADFTTYLAMVMRQKMKDLLAEQSLVYVQEYWTAYNQSSYQVDRLHWIDDDFKMQTLVVACDFDSARIHRESADSMWDSIGVAAKKQVRVVMSNCKDSDIYIGVGKPLIYRGIECDLNHIAEIAYTTLGSNIKDLVSKARKLVETVNSSVTMKEFLYRAQSDLSSFFPKNQTPLPLIEDSRPDCWWSTNEMIDRMLYLRKALEYLTLESRLEQGINLFSKQEWDRLEILTQAWEPLGIATQLLQKQKYVTIGLVPMILQVVGEDLSPEAHDGDVKTCIKKMLAVWEERFGNEFPSDPFHGLPKLVWVAHALDPRFKSLDVFKLTKTSSDVVFDAILTEMIACDAEERHQDDSTACDVPTCEEATERLDNSPPQSHAPTSEIRALASSRLSGTKRGFNRLVERLVPLSMKSRKVVGDPGCSKRKEECLAELSAYRAANGMKMWIEHEDGSKDFEDPLSWWKEYHDDYPTLWKLARRYLPIPATYATSDRAFDTEAHTELAKRCKAQGGSTMDMKLLKENSALVEAFGAQPGKEIETTEEDKSNATPKIDDKTKNDDGTNSQDD